MDVKISKEVRQSVVDWINSKQKNFDAGLAILKATGYKPHVFENIEKHKDRQDSPRKLEGELRLYLRYYINPANSEHDDDDLEDAPEEKAFVSNIEKELANEQYPAIIKQLLTEFSNLYKTRSKAHKELKQVGEDNSDVSVKLRKWLLSVIETMSYRMDELWKAQELFKADGTLPSEEMFKVPFDPEKSILNEDTGLLKMLAEKEPVEKTKNTFVLAETPEDLKKQNDNWRIKIFKTENRLNFQSTKKEEVANPMPVGPKRIVVEKHLAELRKEKELIEYKIAELK